MIEINLIPDVKREYLHAQRMRNGVISLSILVSIIAGAAVALLVVYVGTQSAREWLTDNEIKDQYGKISSVKDANQIVTIQNQLASSPRCTKIRVSTRGSSMCSVPSILLRPMM